MLCLKATKNDEKRKKKRNLTKKSLAEDVRLKALETVGETKKRKTEGEPDVACGSVPYGVSSASGIFQKND